MKRFISVLASLVLIVTVVAVRSVKADYLGDLVRSQPYTLEVQGNTKMSITILVVTSNGRLDLEEALVLDGTTVNTLKPARSRTTSNASSLSWTLPQTIPVFKVCQTHKFELSVTGHEEAVFDVIP